MVVVYDLDTFSSKWPLSKLKLDIKFWETAVKMPFHHENMPI